MVSVWTSHIVRVLFLNFFLQSIVHFYFFSIYSWRQDYFSLANVVKKKEVRPQQQLYLSQNIFSWWSTDPTTLLSPPHMTCKWLFDFTSHWASRNTLQLKKEVALSLFPNEQTSSVLRVTWRQLDLAVNNACGGLAGRCGVHLLFLQTVSGITGCLQGQPVEWNPIRPLAHSLMRETWMCESECMQVNTEACR